MPDLPLHGGCLCGGVRFEVAGVPLEAGYCHCTRCQRRTGTGSAVSARIPPGSLRVLSGEELLRAWTPPDGFAKVFCSACGAHLWSQNEDRSAVAIRMAAFDEDPGVRPSYRQFVAYAVPWEPLPDDGLPRFPERRPA